ncbi:MAG: zinc ribbon domain-containing protein, partial [Candidatus Hermodarchaeota archaeon]
PEMRVKFSKIYGDEGMRVMDKYIIERYCLDRVHKEQIIYELNGKITQFAAKFTGKVRGTIYITNQRIIAQGKFNTNIRNLSFWAGTVLDLPHLTGRHDFLTQSITKYGYQFPTDYIHRLRMSNRELSYFSGKNRIKIIPSDIEELLRTYDVIGGIQKMEERGYYENLEWLRHHYYELGWSIQDIANYQGVSMITVKKWVDKLRSTPIDTKDQEQEISQGKEGKSTCIHCGQVNIDDFKFCISCGKPL